MKSIVKIKNDFVAEVTAGNYSTTLDRPADMGGTEGMCPGEAMLSAIGGCKVMSFKMAVQAKGLNLEDFKEIEVEVSAEMEGIGTLEGTKMPLSRIKSLHTIYKLKTSKSREDIEDILKAVDQLCVVGQALDHNITKTQEIVLV